MRIVYVGNFKHSWCTEVHVTRDAERIEGVKVARIQEPRLQRSYEHFFAQVERVAADADVLVYQRTWGLPPEAIDMWRRIEANGCQTISYHLDLYLGLEREQGIEDDPFWRTGVVFTADGDPRTTTALAKHGIDHRWMPAAIVSDEAVPGVAHNVGVHEVLFMGSAGARYHPEWPWRRTLLMGLDKRYGPRFLRLPRDGVRVHGPQLSGLYASMPVVVGDSLALPGHCNYWSDRFYETVGRGGYLIGPNVPGIQQHFKSGEHLDLYELGDLDHVFELVDQALANRDDAREIARAGQAHVAANHTYTHRVRAIAESLGLPV